MYHCCPVDKKTNSCLKTADVMIPRPAVAYSDLHCWACPPVVVSHPLKRLSLLLSSYFKRNCAILSWRLGSQGRDVAT